MDATTMSPTRMQCMQVWGGNQATETAVATTGLDVWLHSDPYGDAHAGGDVYYLSSCSSGRITRLALADVSGHGSRVSEVAAGLRRLMQVHINRIDQTKLVYRINQEFGGIGDSASFATALIGTYFLPTRTLTVTNAGHPPPFFYSARRRSWSTWGPPRCPGREPVDLPLGMFDGTRYGQFEVKLADGDRALWLTDSVIEADDEHGEMLGTDGVRTLLNELATNEVGAVIPELLTRIREMSRGGLTHDDTTAILLTPNTRSVSLRDDLLAPFRLLSQALRSSTWIVAAGAF